MSRMSCIVTIMTLGCRLRRTNSSSQNATNSGSGGFGGSGDGNVSTVGSGVVGRSVGGIGSGGNGRSSVLVDITNTGGIHIGGKLKSTTALETTTDVTTPLQRRQQRQSRKRCCLCWCFCCSCSWSNCWPSKNPRNNEPKQRNPPNSELLLNEEPPSLEEIRSWGHSFDKLMKSPTGRIVFSEFLRGEFSEENIQFWQACEDLKKEINAEAIEEKARIIYEDFISILSPREVSLDARVREIVNRNMVEPTSHTFDEAQIQIYTLMLRDSYPRFINSPNYKKLAQLQDGMTPSGSTADSPT